MRTQIALAFALVLLVGGVLHALVSKPDPNEIVDTLPVFPGAHQSARYRNGSDVELHYTIPPSTRKRELERFYSERMGPWWRRPDAGCDGFTREGALVIAGRDTFDRMVLRVIVAPDGAGSCQDYESILAS
jgi:hypothetical protein